MDLILQGMITAGQQIITFFVNVFNGLTAIFHTTGENPQLSFVGGLLVIGLVVMFVFMILRWIISLVRRI